VAAKPRAALPVVADKPMHIPGVPPEHKPVVMDDANLRQGMGGRLQAQ
jgi:hypothetical protein